MNRELIKLLKQTPGIIIVRQSIRYESIPFPDSLAMLKMHSPDTLAEKGAWIRVLKGGYRGDVGLIIAMKSWGVEVVLIPRLSTPQDDLTPGPSTSTKRKRTSIRPEPSLFDPNSIRGPRLKKLPNGRYKFAGNLFEHGLILKRLDLHSFKSNPLNIPFESFSLFRSSRHPAILTSQLPQPQEWLFDENDSVIIPSSKKVGIVLAVKPTYAEVKLSNGEGIIIVPFHDILKMFVSGTSITITGGAFRGRAGLVVKVDGETAQVLEKTNEGIHSHIDASHSLQVFTGSLLQYLYSPTL